jgi:2,4-dienoyl-CoA reductase-like NADH-dependent reductase (Old Yellow Enzyme family)
MNDLAAPLLLPCGVRLPNRFLKSAMSETLAGPDGAPNERHVRLYRTFARGGAGTIVTGNVMIDHGALGEPGNVVADRAHFEAFREWARASAGTRALLFLQVNHPGKQSPRHLSPEPVAPSAIPLAHGIERYFATPRALESDEIEALVERFGHAADLAKKAGFSGVQIHGAHGYLVSQFLSPRHNQRDDAWGGDAERRRRFVLEVYRSMRRAVGDRFPVSIKLNSADFQQGGFSEDESLAVVRALADAGIDFVEISGGTYEAPAMVDGGRRESTRRREAYFLEFAERVRRELSVPLAVTGGFRSARGMREALDSGATDLVGIARALALDPELPNKVLAGEDYVAELRQPSTGIRALDRASMLNVTWYEHQLHRMADGKPPAPTLGAWRSVWGTLWQNGVGALRRRRA